MALKEYCISYQSMPNVTFPSATAAKKYLEREEAAWSGFLGDLEKNNFPGISARGAQVNAQQYAGSFQHLKGVLGEPSEFNSLTERALNRFVVPPPSDSLEGQLILGLACNGRKDEALFVFAWFAWSNLGRQPQQNRPKDFIEKGAALFDAAKVAEALPYHKVSSQKLTRHTRKAESLVAALNAKVNQADTINEEHAEKLTAIRDEIAVKAVRLRRLAQRLWKARRRRYDDWVDGVDQATEERISESEAKLLKVAGDQLATFQSQNAEYERLHELFYTQLRLRAPVQLWEGRSATHRTASQRALARFVGLTVFALLVGVLVPAYYGDYIANSFFERLCDSGDPPTCERVFSAKGPLTITGLLLVMSLVLWVTRLQYKVFLSERHLALDASEKQAFAETYLAMKEGEDVNTANEAIVLASLFRPTQDGIIKDDETAVDLSAAAMLAKHMGRSQ